MRYGINIGQWNGSIDWENIKTSNIEFAILKSTTKDNREEPAFQTNYAGCINAGIYVGAYRYVYARTVEEAVAEAEALITVLKDKNINYRVWLDVEDDSIHYLGAETLSLIIDTEAAILESEGFSVGIFCTYDWYKNILDVNYLVKKYPFWISRTGTDSGDLQEEYSPELIAAAWQYTTRGIIAGINGEVNLNVSFDEICTSVGETKYELGQSVSYSTFYKGHSDELCSAKKNKEIKNGIITSIDPEQRNSYQINNSPCCFLNNENVIEVIKTNDSNSIYHTVEENENLTLISKKYDTSITEILKLNPIIISKSMNLTGITLKIK